MKHHKNTQNETKEKKRVTHPFNKNTNFVSYFFSKFNKMKVLVEMFSARKRNEIIFFKLTWTSWWFLIMMMMTIMVCFYLSVCVYTDISKSKFLKKQQIQFNYFALLVSFFVSLYLIYNHSSLHSIIFKKKVKVIRN